MRKVLLDTDIGTDVDDAVCLAYLLSQAECELLGITTVTGEADKRASLASVLCRAARKDIPIYPGAELPMQGPQRQQIAQQAAALPRWPHETRFPQGKAVDFMARTVRAHPGQVTLLTIGPLTNAGLLFSRCPDVPGLLEGFVMMGGVFDNGLSPAEQVEGNILGDPVAARIVYQTSVRLHRSIGLNVTQKVVMPADEVRRKFVAPLLRPVLDFAEIWFSQFYPFITFHDPLAGATLFDDGLCAYESGTATVGDSGIRGRTAWQPGPPEAPHQVAVQVDTQRYFEHFFSVLQTGH